jgi:predicted dehydrogenase
LANNYGTKNMVGYNRRYYSIFNKGIKLINKYGPLLGVSIEGHERFWNIENAEFSELILKNWIYANSTHTIDLLRFFGGEIKSISTYSKKLKKNMNDQFVAAMEFNSGALGTYTSHWFSPGGWTVKLYGEEITVKFKPLERGIWFDTDFVEHSITPDEVDINFKPGFYGQLLTFEELIRNNKLNWPGTNLENALITMELAKKLSNV